MADAGADQASYDAAVAAAATAAAAAQAAQDASDAAAAAATSADAAAQQAIAEGAKADAETARDNAMTYTGMVAQAKTDADAAAKKIADEATALSTAQGAAMDAHDAAGMARDTAQQAVDAVRDGMDINAATTAAFERAEAAATAANDAYLDAVAANTAALAATTSAEAEGHQADAETAQRAAATASAQAQTFAGIVQAAIDADDAVAAQAAADAAEATALTDAKAAAIHAAYAAEAAAADAQAAAEAIVALTGAGSQQAMDAQAAADAANMAAIAARAAADAAQADTISADAMTEQATAETQKGEAATQLAIAQELRRQAQVASDAAALLQEQRDIEVAQDAAQAAASRAGYDHFNAAANATAAGERATAAGIAADRADDARTDATKARTQATAAADAAVDAEAARVAAEQAKNDAETARDMALGATTADDAEMYRDAAVAAQMVAYAEWEKSLAKYEEANTALVNAETAANTHVLELFKMANAVHINRADDPDANTDETEEELIDKNKAAHVAAVNTAIAGTAGTDAGDDNTDSPTTASSVWQHSAMEANDAATEDTARDGKLLVTVTIDGGTGITTMADTDTVMDGDQPNFRDAQGGSLGDFTHGIEMFSGDTRILLFTDKEQASEPVDAHSNTVDNASVSMADRVAITAAVVDATDTTARNFPGSYDHDGDPETPPFAGTFTCADPLTCRVDLQNTTDGGAYQLGTTVSSIANYRFTGTQTMASRNAMEDLSYLVFGVWLQETEVEAGQDSDGVNTYEFGAFHGGGTPGPVHADITGTATYDGSAAGVHSTATKVDFFSADATLEADFDASDAGHTAEIHGTIHNIVAGGVPLDGYGDNIIYLDLNDHAEANVADDGSFDGRSRLGDRDQRVDREFDYVFEGTWSGDFYNGVQDVQGTADVNEAETTQPDSVAGTFGVRDSDSSESFVGAFGAHKE